VGKSDAGAVVAIEDPARNIYGLQYHPEVKPQALNPFPFSLDPEP
jgi:GMP synthase-like glutamine amidotransferase